MVFSHQQFLCNQNKPFLFLFQITSKEGPHCATFVMYEEDHTLGNVLRYLIMKNPQVDFCGYSIPHPSEKKINMRIQTHGEPAIDCFRKGLKDLSLVCDHMKHEFEKELKRFQG
eukprot:Sdes_comp19673_c0_seq2m11535